MPRLRAALVAVLLLPGASWAQGHSSSSATATGPNSSASSSASSSSSTGTARSTATVGDCVVLPPGASTGSSITMGPGGMSGSATAGPGGTSVQINPPGAGSGGAQSWTHSQSQAGCVVVPPPVAPR